jgi:hypothetical protein
MTQLNDKDHAAQMADMKSFDEEMPSIGIFWYDPEDHSLFGVGKKELTPKMVEEARAKGVDVINYPESEYGYKAAIEREESHARMNSSEREQARVKLKEYFRAQAKNEETKFTGDYTQVPRGRVAWNVNKFIVLVGKWAEPVQDELTQLIEDTFHLPYFEFVYDHHWDLGHGWSGDMPK